MGSGYISGKTNIPTAIATYSGAETETADVTVNNNTNQKTIEVDVKSVPNSLDIALNDKDASSTSFDGSESIDIDLKPIVLLDEDEEPNYSDDSVGQIFRRPISGNFIHEPFIINREFSQPVEAYVDAPKDNTAVTSQNFFSLFDDPESLQILVDSASITSVTTYVPSGGDINAFRIGTSSGVGTITLNLNYTVDSITLSARKYNTEANGKLIVNGIETELSFDFDDYTINFPSKVSTITINNATSGGQKQRILLNMISTGGEGGETFIEKELAFKDDIPTIPTNLVTTDTAQSISGDKTISGDLTIHGDSYISGDIEITKNHKEVYISDNDGILNLNVLALLKYSYDENEDKTFIEFPGDVIPEYFAEDELDYLWFNYKDGVVVNSNNEPKFDIHMNNGVVISIDGEHTSDDFYFYDLVYSRGSPENKLDYSKLGPNGGGTKLYKHVISIDGYSVRIISTINTSATTGSQLDNVIDNATSASLVSEGFNGFVISDYENSMFVFVNIDLTINDTIDYYNTEFIDTVTPL